MLTNNLALFGFLLLSLFPSEVLTYSPQQKDAASLARRSFLVTSASPLVMLIPGLSSAHATRYILNEETGDYDEVKDVKWQEAWKDRLDKAQSMSSNDVFMAARGAGNADQKNLGDESLASQKRRAMAGCRDEKLIEKTGIRDPKECTSRVLRGEVNFMLNAMQGL